MTTPAISAADVTKRYGDLTAVDGVSLEVSPGEIFGIIGPNGAGKTTFMECLEGLRLPDSGEILEEHRFPLFEYTGLYQKLRVPAAGVQVESIVVSLEEAAERDTQYLLNLVVASGYVAEDADLTFRENRAGGYLYTYFNIQPLEA